MPEHDAGLLRSFCSNVSAEFLVDIRIILGVVELSVNVHSMVQEQRVVLGNLLAFLSGFDLADDG
uniref:Uncharacterized protein n=1 Tax=Arundo donax TaxID=35708 RepID=A0A0A9HEN9_ARUDO